jgi:hypothetical protein
MKINQALVPFKPVTITFETQEELKNFVDYVGEVHESESGVPFLVWDELHDIAYGLTLC